MTLNRVKLGRAVTFSKYLASVISLIFLTKNLIWNKITFWLSNSLNLAELVVNELTKSISIKKKKVLGIVTVKERDNFSKILISIAFC